LFDPSEVGHGWQMVIEIGQGSQKGMEKNWQALKSGISSAVATRLHNEQITFINKLRYGIQ
ncbi:hypothetical protein SK128_018764, partial [Halocaridina rubra]